MRRERWAVPVLTVMIAFGIVGFCSSGVTPRAPPVHSQTSASVDFSNLTRQGLVIPMGPASAADGLQVGHPAVLVHSSGYQMWYFEVSTSYYCQIAYATSVDGRSWTKYGAVLWPTYPDEGHNTAYPSVVLVNGTYWMFYDGTPNIDASDYRIFAATSPNGVNWTKFGVVLDLGPAGGPDGVSLLYPHALYVNGVFDLWYTGLSSLTPPGNGAMMFAQSTNGLNWTKRGVVLTNGTAGSLDSYNAVAGSVARVGSGFVMVYDGESAYLTSNLLYAVSADGVHWTKEGLALARDPPAETYLAQPDVIVSATGGWSVYYVVRDYSSDLQIYLATSPAATSYGPAPSSSLPPLLAQIVGVVSPVGFVAMVTGLGAFTGAGLGYLRERLRHRRAV